MVRDHPDYLSLKLQAQKNWIDSDFQTFVECLTHGSKFSATYAPCIGEVRFFQPFVTLLGKQGTGDPETQAINSCICFKAASLLSSRGQRAGENRVTVLSRWPRTDTLQDVAAVPTDARDPVSASSPHVYIWACYCVFRKFRGEGGH